MWPINLSISVAWQALTMQIFFNLKIMIGIHIFWGVMTILSFSLWFIARIKNTPDKNKCFWVCLVGTTLPTEKVKITINSNIPRDSIELIISSNYEAHSTDLP